MASIYPPPTVPSSQRPFSPQDILTQKKRSLLVRTMTTTTTPGTTILGSALYKWNRPASLAIALKGGNAQRFAPATAGVQGVPESTLPCCSS
jgi:hypothetical protein